MSNKRTWIIPLALFAAGSAAFGQGPGGGPPNGEGPGDGPPPPPPMPPVIRVLDANHDGIIDANEIADAPQELMKLLKSGSNSLTIGDLLGPPPPRGGRHRGGPRPAPGTTGTTGTSADSDSQDGPPPPPDGPPPAMTGTSASADSQDGPPPPPDGPPPGRGPGGHHRPPPVIEALDTNHDGIIDATEIANAAQSLRTLIKNGSNQLTIPDLLGPPRGHRPPPPPDEDQPPPEQSGSSSQTDTTPPRSPANPTHPLLLFACWKNHKPYNDALSPRSYRKGSDFDCA